MSQYIVIPKKDFETLVSRYREALQIIRARGNGFVGAYERELSDLLSNRLRLARREVFMSIETAIQEVSEILAYQENDRPEDNTELARMIVEKVERNLTQRAADVCTCGHGEDSHFAIAPFGCDWCACGAYKRR